MNTLPNTIAYEGDAPGDVEFLVRTFEQFAERNEHLHVSYSYDHARDDKPWRCGHPHYRPTFGATRREAVELMIVKCVKKRLSDEPSVASMRKHLKEVFSG